MSTAKKIEKKSKKEDPALEQARKDNYEFAKNLTDEDIFKTLKSFGMSDKEAKEAVENRL